MRQNQITVALLTFNRLDRLSTCLNSLRAQTREPQQIIIFDNSLTQSAKPIIDRMWDKLPLVYVPTHTFRSVAESRNQALQLCRTQYLAFIDDDCIADLKWVETGWQVLLKNPSLGYVVGQSKVQNDTNLVAIAEYCHHQYWFTQEIVGKKTTSPLNLDTKNIILNLKNLPSTIRFHELFSIHSIDSSDTDFGYQLERANIRGEYSKKMIVSHQEIASLSNYIQKKYIKGQLAYRIVSQWQLVNEFVDPVNKKWWTFLKSLRHISLDWKKYIPLSSNHSFIRNVLVLSIIKWQQKAFTDGYYFEHAKSSK